MPRKRRIPSYCHHKASGQAMVRISGRYYYLGKFGTEESYERYDRLIRQHLGAIHVPAPDGSDGARDRLLDPSINELLLAFLEHAQTHYQKDGRPTSEVANFRRVARLLKCLYGHEAAGEFSPRHLKACQESMIEEGLCRKTINGHCNRIRHIFRWAIGEELVAPSVLEGLRAVLGLQKGRTAARETDPVLPVPWRRVKPILPLLSPQLRAVVHLLWYTGSRPGEICRMRTIDLETTGRVWCYTPAGHKMEHFGRARKVWLGPKAQDVLRPWLRRNLHEYLFQPAEAEAPRFDQPPLRRRFHEHYTTVALRHAIHRACDQTGIPRWSPNQLRHARATEVRKRYGIEAASIILGHAKTDTTLIYAEANEGLGRRVALEMG